MVFIIAAKNETQFFFLLTKMDSVNKVFHYNENDKTVVDTRHSFLEYCKAYLQRYQPGTGVGLIGHGELISL